jgi:transcriptional regulator with XRE-family HTH domain
MLPEVPTETETWLTSKSALFSMSEKDMVPVSSLCKLAELHYTHIGRFERGTSLPGSETLKRLAVALDVTSDYLLEGAQDEAAKARFEDREFLRLFREIEKLPEEDKTVIKIFLDAFLTKKQIKLLAK